MRLLTDRHEHKHSHSPNGSYIVQLHFFSPCGWIAGWNARLVCTSSKDMRQCCLFLSLQYWPSVLSIIPHSVLKVISCSTMTRCDISTDWSQGVRLNMSFKPTLYIRLPKLHILSVLKSLHFTVFLYNISFIYLPSGNLPPFVFVVIN